MTELSNENVSPSPRGTPAQLEALGVLVLDMVDIPTLDTLLELQHGAGPSADALRSQTASLRVGLLNAGLLDPIHHQPTAEAIALRDRVAKAPGRPRMSTPDLTTELEAIRQRARIYPGGCSTDAGKTPVVHKSFEEIALDRLLLAAGSPVYVRRKAGATESDQVKAAFELLRPVLQPAYDAQVDRLRLLAIVEGLIDRIATAPSQGLYGVAVILRRRSDGAVLMGQRLGAYGAGSWGVVCGKPLPGEPPLETARRELREETGLSADLRLLPFWTWCGGDPAANDYVSLWAEGYVAPGDVPVVMEPEKCRGWRWIREDDLPDPLFRPLAAMLSDGRDLWTRGCPMMGGMG